MVSSEDLNKILGEYKASRKEEDLIVPLVTGSACLSGASISELECADLFDRNLCPGGRTVDEILLCLDLKKAYEDVFADGTKHSYFGAYRLRELAKKAFSRNGIFNPDNEDMSGEMERFCARLDIERKTAERKDELTKYLASFNALFQMETMQAWLDGSGIIGRLVMAMVQHWFNLPVLILQQKHKNAYFEALKKSVISDNPEHFQTFLMNVLTSQLGHGEKKEKSRDAIIRLLKENKYLTAEKLSAEIGISKKAVEQSISRMKADGILKRVGPDKSGFWEIV